MLTCMFYLAISDRKQLYIRLGYYFVNYMACGTAVLKANVVHMKILQFGYKN